MNVVSRGIINDNHRSLAIFQIISKFGATNKIKSIWDVGSCDGKDAKVLSSVFPEASVYSFEPNPDTFFLVKEIADKSGGSISAYNLALSDTNSVGVFHKIDTVNTKTTWENGNPGASSIFKANGLYDIEDYVQLPVAVKFSSGENLIKNEECGLPNLIWMDVQGAEGLVLRGFGDFLTEIDFIYVELSLKEIYSGQALAADVIKLLGKNFYWYQNLNLGFWQFDALFVNKKYRSFNLLLRNLLLLSSFKSNLGLGIKVAKLPLRSYLSTAKKYFLRCH